MSTRIRLVRGDTKPIIIVSLTDDTTGDPIGVNSATVRMYFRATGDQNILATIVGNLLPGRVNTDGSIDTASPYDTPGAGGRVQFVWQPGNLDQEAGSYEGEIEITNADGSVQTVYDLLKFKLREDF